jgi:arabinose-5-phosphate isomerase
VRKKVGKESASVLARQVLEHEGRAILALGDQLNEKFCQAIEILMNCSGKVIITGIGKPGHVGKKIAASLASLGTPSFFLHADEGLHGDSGMVTEKDVVVVISQSGETAEALALLAILKKISCKIISITGHLNCTLARKADVALVTGVSKEADPLDLAPSTSSTAMLALGDALAITLSQLKGFSRKDFALFHPGGSLGKRLLGEKID